MGDNAVIGSFKRTEAGDNVRDLFASFGLFPLEGELSTWGEDQNIADAWRDSPLWYYQFLLARHTSVYSWPGDWWPESIAHLRAFNDWRKNPRVKSVLKELARPVYNGPDWIKNEGPWCWSFIDAAQRRALVFAVNHRELNTNNAFAAKLRGLDEGKTYLVEEITQQPDGWYNYRFRGEFTGAQLKERGFPVNLDAGEEACAAFWLQEKTAAKAQVLYADAAVTRYGEKPVDDGLAVAIEGTPVRRRSWPSTSLAAAASSIARSRWTPRARRRRSSTRRPLRRRRGRRTLSRPRPHLPPATRPPPALAGEIRNESGLDRRQQLETGRRLRDANSHRHNPCLARRREDRAGLGAPAGQSGKSSPRVGPPSTRSRWSSARRATSRIASRCI